MCTERQEMAVQRLPFSQRVPSFCRALNVLWSRLKVAGWGLQSRRLGGK